MTSTAKTLEDARPKLTISWPSRSTRRRYGLFALLVAPALLLRFGTAIYPIIQTILYSFRDFSLLRGTDEFVGLENYYALSSNFGVRSAVSFTVLYVVASTILELILGLLIAQLLNANFKGRTFARTINLIPWALPTIVAGYMFRWLLDEQFGLIPYWVTRITGDPMVVFIDPVGSKIAVIRARLEGRALYGGGVPGWHAGSRSTYMRRRRWTARTHGSVSGGSPCHWSRRWSSRWGCSALSGRWQLRPGDGPDQWRAVATRCWR